MLISECAVLKIAPDVPADLIIERLSVKGCASVKCSPEQESAVCLVAEECGQILTAEKGEDEGEGGGILGSIFGGLKALANTKMINAADYKF